MIHLKSEKVGKTACDKNIEMIINFSYNPYKVDCNDCKDTKEYKDLITNHTKTFHLRQEQWISHNNLKAGDAVKVFKKCKSFENGWGYYWCDDMDKYIGNTYEIQCIDTNDNGICLKDDTDYVGYIFPYFCLEPYVEQDDENIFDMVEQLNSDIFKKTEDAELASLIKYTTNCVTESVHIDGYEIYNSEQLSIDCNTRYHKKALREILSSKLRNKINEFNKILNIIENK